ncbi:efflux RND transporter periplasmic adaptor subunit [Alcanivorax sp. JB21]|uniref:efflux RND transporter periplasmic adaptor subunit n=1 Tax=Alcanivorax limicola TaxID=2874102 RepID=UPI001CBE0FEC|nr:efflux RND transporter periplasmic adaptor subunit [Alcanivorax limicola]MBZ2189542.1 efflux RND transporter periplasmic adaptor subunit [Alcanivorax limicola]
MTRFTNALNTATGAAARSTATTHASRHTSRHTSRQGIRILAALLFGAVTLAGCEAHSDADFSMAPPEVDVAEVLGEPVTLWDTYTGRVEAPETVALRPRVSGYIDEVAFREGALVEAGDLLFRIDPRPYQARVQAARAELSRTRSQVTQAESEATRATQLLASRAVSQEEYDQRRSALLTARAQADAAEAALESARLDLAYTEVRAPVSGRVGRAMVTRGNLANADQTLLTSLVSVDPLHVYFNSDEQAAIDNQVVTHLLPPAGHGVPVRIALGGDGTRTHRGELDFIDNRLHASTGTLQYRAVLPNPEGLFRPGQFARVSMPVAQLEQALLVDRKAVLTDQDRRFVYVVDDNNMTARRQVITGREIDGLLVIREGLQDGDRVVVNGIQKIFGAGMMVAPQRVAMRDAARLTADSVAAMP